MEKAKLLKSVSAHRKFFRFCTKVYNGLNLRNKLHAKGCRAAIGISELKGLKIISEGVGNEVVVGDFVKIVNSRIILRGNHNKVQIGDFAYLNQVELYAEDSDNEISIGTRTGLHGAAHLAAIEGTKITIGNDCLLSGNLQFRTGDSHSILNLQGERINASKDITIDDHVWIGTGVTCLKGTHVARDSVVAATATLCKDYDTPHAIIAGVPGRVIKTDIDWKNERI